jgi:DNA repair exonuclease SbcCD ATPase subunit
MTDLDSLTLQVRNRRRQLDGLLGEARSVLVRRKEVLGEIDTLSDEVNDFERVTGLLNSLGEERQLKAQQTIEELVTRGLQTIFDDTLSFHIVQTVKGKTASVEFLVRTTLGDTIVETPVMDARGGGLAATIGFLLRVVVMLLRGGTREENILVLDETFAHVSAEYLPPLGEFLREIVDKTGVQIVMVTHQPEFTEYADKVYRFTQDDQGKTQVSEDA